MINFLDHPDNFAMQIRLASADKRTLCKIALIQVKKAGRISEMGNSDLQRDTIRPDGGERYAD